MTRSEFVEDVFYEVAWNRRGLVVGSVNVVYDLTRLAIGHHVSRPRRRDRTMRGGFTLKLSEHPGTHRSRSSGSTGGRPSFASSPRPDATLSKGTGNGVGTWPTTGAIFIDVGVLGSALLGGKWSLKRLAETLGTTSRKLSVESHDRDIDAEYLDYTLADVQTSWECFVAPRDRYDALGLSTPIYRLYSEASVAKAHLREMGIRPWREVQPEAPDWLVATILETYYGGRTEAGIRHLPVPGTYVDVRSEYPTVYVLQKLWRNQIASGIDWVLEDPEGFRSWADGLSVDDFLDPELWPRLTAVVLVEPDHDRLPTRASFAGGSAYNVAIAERSGGPVGHRR